MWATETITLQELQNYIYQIYGQKDQRNFDIGELLINMERFIMQSLKAIRKNDQDRAIINLVHALSWYISAVNWLQINLTEQILDRFPYACPYCVGCPCYCNSKKIKRKKTNSTKTFIQIAKVQDLQKMFYDIYPHKKDPIEHLGIHLVEECGEFSEAIMLFRSEHKSQQFKQICQESTDLFSCFVAIFNHYHKSLAKEFSKLFYNNCHACHQAPCICTFDHIAKFKS